MKLIDRYILKEHALPFLFALLVLLFVLLANFLLRSIDKFLGKGLNILVLLEFVFLNLAWILALAVPMAVLVATLMAFGRMSSDNEITAIRSSGIGYRSLLKPSIWFGLIITIGMILFNNWLLPDMNHKARMLSSDIRRKRPDLEFDVGYFIDALPGHSILLGGRNGDEFTDVTIFGNGTNQAQRTILAQKGIIETLDDGVLLYLTDGVIHELPGTTEEYRQIYFDHYQVAIPVDNMQLTRRDSNVRGDREMNFQMIRKKIDGYYTKIDEVWERIHQRISNETTLELPAYPPQSVMEETLDDFESMQRDSIQVTEDETAMARFNRHFKNLRRGVSSDYKLMESYIRSINKYKVELHKKFSIPFASIIFIIVGAPLGIMARRGGFAISMGLSMGFFIIYWAFLITGEELADRGFLSPVMSMWMPNMIMGIAGAYLVWMTSRENRVINFEILNIFKRKKQTDDSAVPE